MSPYKPNLRNAYEVFIPGEPPKVAILPRWEIQGNSLVQVGADQETVPGVGERHLRTYLTRKAALRYAVSFRLENKSKVDVRLVKVRKETRRDTRG